MRVDNLFRFGRFEIADANDAIAFDRDIGRTAFAAAAVVNGAALNQDIEFRMHLRDYRDDGQRGCSQKQKNAMEHSSIQELDHRKVDCKKTERPVGCLTARHFRCLVVNIVRK